MPRYYKERPKKKKGFKIKYKYNKMVIDVLRHHVKRNPLGREGI